MTRESAHVALTRAVSPMIGRCELTHVARTPIDAAIAADQHRAYERCLEELGCAIERLDGSSDLPDCVFVEDLAVVFDELAVATRPGAESRRAETPPIAAAIARYRPVRPIEAPATVDGGDVLHLGRDVFIGRSARTNAAGVEQMESILGAYGYRIRAVTVRGCLHLKSAASAVADDLLVVNPDWIDVAEFAGIDLVEVDPGEPFAANALRVGECLVHGLAFPRTRRRLEQRGLVVRTVDVSELAKAEGGVTCCSILFDGDTRLPERRA